MLKLSKAMLGHIIAVPLAAAATVGSAWLLAHFPGLPHFNNDQITATASAIGLAGAGLALHYLKGLREWQRLEAAGVISAEGEGSGLGAELDPRLHGFPVSPPSGASNIGDAGRAHVEPEAPVTDGAA